MVFKEVNEKTEKEPLTIVPFAAPRELEFCGEKVPLHDEGVLEKLDKELHVTTFRQSSMVLQIKRANRWFPIFDKVLSEREIPTDFKYLAAIESGLENVISPSNAVGFWQFLKGTGKDYGLQISRNVDERYDPVKSAAAAADYLADAKDRFGSWTNAAASYNMGQNGFRRQLDWQKVESYYDMALNEETSRYVYRILAFKEIYENQHKYGFYIPDSTLYSPLKYQELEVATTISDLAQVAIDNDITYSVLRRYNPWIRGRKLIVRPGKKYILHIPI